MSMLFNTKLFSNRRSRTRRTKGRTQVALAVELLESRLVPWSVSTAIYNAATNMPISGIVPLGTSVYDTATVMADTTPPMPPPAGTTLTYYFYNTATPVFGMTTPVSTETVTVTSSGAVPNSSVIGPLTAGSYSFIGVFQDGSMSAVEPFTVSRATPAINTQQQPATATVGSSIADKATVTGGFNPTGTVTFNLYNNPNGTGPALFTDTEPLVGGMATSTGYTATATGTDYWVATYNGDSNNSPVTSGTAQEPVTITPATPPSVTITKTADSASIAAGQTAGFTVTITSTGTSTATGLMLSDPLPAGAGSDINWMIDTTTGNPTDFTISGPVASQSLGFSSSFVSAGDSLAAGQTIKVHITGLTSTMDANTSTNPALGSAAGYTVLYEGTGGHNLSITNVTINGNVGVGGTGVVQFSGPGTIGGRLDFSAANTGQFHNNNGSNVGPTSVNYNVGAVTTALNTVNSLSSSLAGLGNVLTINGTQTINESAGKLDTVNGVTYRVFSVTSYSENDGKVVTINGDGSGDPVVFNFGSNTNVNLGGDVTLTGGLTPDQVLWNFTSSNQNIQLNNNASSYPQPAAFMGVILAPNDKISVVNTSLDGRIYGGDSQDMQIVSGDTIHTPPMTGTLVNAATVSGSNITTQSAMATITVTAPLHMWAASAAAAQLPPLDTLGEVTAGLYLVAVDGLAPGAVGKAQQARIEDALAILNTELGSLGVQMVEVAATDTSANVHVHLASTTPVGGLADGVLGVTIGEDITIVNAGNYYLGSDPAGIAPWQYDFETLAVHELAHAVGLGEGVDPSSAMYPYLATGTVRRDLSKTELTALGVPSVATDARLVAAGGLGSTELADPLAASNGPNPAVPPILADGVSSPSTVLQDMGTALAANSDRSSLAATDSVFAAANAWYPITESF